MDQTETKPRLLLPFLQPFYDRVIPLSWPIVRCAVGLMLMVHGWPKAARAPAIIMALLSGGSPRGAWFFLPLAAVEFIGGLCIAAGLFTRFFAPAAAIEMAYLTFRVHWDQGFLAERGGYEYVLMWGLILFAVALRGGGPYSLDRRLGREL